MLPPAKNQAACGQWVLFDNVSVNAAPGQTITASITGAFSAATSVSTGYFGLCYQYTDSANVVVTQPFTDPNFRYVAGGTNPPSTASVDATTQIGQLFVFPTGVTSAYSASVNVSGSVTIPAKNPAGNTIPAGPKAVGICNYWRPGANLICLRPHAFGFDPGDAASYAQGFVEVSN